VGVIHSDSQALSTKWRHRRGRPGRTIFKLILHDRGGAGPKD